MHVRYLSLVDFRSWAAVDLPLAPGVNVLLGENGAGKTNLAEALGYLATLSSHRVAGDQALIRRGTEQALVRAAVVSAGRELLLEVEIGAGRANRARINRAPLTRARDVLGALRTVLFAPEDLVLVRGDPGERRRFLDEVLVMRTPRLAGARADYERVLKQRVALLKSAAALRRGGRFPRGSPAGSPAGSTDGPSTGAGAGEEPGSAGSGSPLSTLEVWDEHLARAGAAVLVARIELFELIRPHVVAAYADLAPGSEPADLAYRHSLGAAAPADPAGMSGLTEDDWFVAMLSEMSRLRPQELDRGVCLVGPHRDDLEIRLGDGPAKGYASHGESWSLALALRLGAFGLLRCDGVDPVLVLDDVFAELDTARRDRLAALVAPADQVLVTAAVPDDVPAGFAGKSFRVSRDGVQEQL